MAGITPFRCAACWRTAGLPVTLQALAGPRGTVRWLDHFGYSAPYQVLDEKFGFTADHVYREVLRFLKWKD